MLQAVHNVKIYRRCSRNKLNFLGDSQVNVSDTKKIVIICAGLTRNDKNVLFSSFEKCKDQPAHAFGALKEPNVLSVNVTRQYHTLFFHLFKIGV